MGKFQLISKRDNRTKGVSITIGVDGRMYLSQGLKNLLQHKASTKYFLYYDAEDNRIGISTSHPDANMDAFDFNTNGEGRVVSFVEDCEIHIPGKPITWLYEAKEGGIYVFYAKGRRQTSFKQERNGNLEKIN